jgi:hypothetical protein
MQIPGHPSEILAPRQGRQQVEVGNTHNVGVVWALIQMAGSEARKGHSIPLHLFHVGGRHQLGFWCSAQLDKGAQIKFYPLLTFLRPALIVHQLLLPAKESPKNNLTATSATSSGWILSSALASIYSRRSA